MTMTEFQVDAFRCCDTGWRVGIDRQASPQLAAEARELAFRLEGSLNAFGEASSIRRLEREGSVRDADVARIVGRGLEYSARTRGAFDIRRGRLQYAIKTYLRGGALSADGTSDVARVRVSGDAVVADAPIDLNGLAKGYIVDRVHAFLAAAGVEHFVDGGGDLSPPPGPVAIEDPSGEGRLGVLQTDWNVATSGPSRRRRGQIDHLYDPRTGRPGSLHDQVTVVAQRDCMEADALATTLCVLPLEDGRRLVEQWSGAAALWVDGGRLFASQGFDRHVWHA